MYNSILVPTDGSELSAKAVEQAIGLAKACGALMTTLHVIPPFEELPAADLAERYEASVKRRTHIAGVRETGHPERSRDAGESHARRHLQASGCRRN